MFGHGFGTKVSDGRLKEDILVNGVTVGNVTTGRFYPAGTSYEQIHRDELVKPGEYQKPALNLAASSTKDYEAGSLIDTIVSTRFIQNDAGAVSNIDYFRNGGQIHVAAAEGSYVVPQFAIGDENVSFMATAHYEAGVLKDGYTGTPIEAGQVNSAQVLFRGLRNLFFDCSKPSATSADIRAFANKILNPVKGKNFKIKVPGGTTSVKIAYKASVGTIASIKYVEGANSEIKDSFTSKNLAVAGTNNFAAVDYLVYEWNPSAPISQDITLDVTI
jgi:hypothetical protein